MVHFVGAGCGAPDLITVRGAKLLSEADVIIYAGSLVNPALLEYAKEDCEIHDSGKMTLEEIGAKFDLTRERVRQIKEKAIRRLKGQKSRLLKTYLGD